jgi:YfiH family protein
MSLAIRSERLSQAGFAHGFFTRHAAPDWADASAELGIGRDRLYLLSQVHGREVRVLAGSEPADDIRRIEGDITASSRAGVACGVRVADCAPVLLADRRSGAVAAVHSGWRGTVLEAARAGVSALTAMGGDPADLVAAIGPHIEACCFEVGEDVAAEIAKSSPLGDRAIVQASPRPHVDLRAVIAAQLERAGVRDIDHVGGCTVCDIERFYSYRRDGKGGGRMLAAVVARPPAAPAAPAAP